MYGFLSVKIDIEPNKYIVSGTSFIKKNHQKRMKQTILGFGGAIGIELSKAL